MWALAHLGWCVSALNPHCTWLFMSLFIAWDRFPFGITIFGIEVGPGVVLDGSGARVERVECGASCLVL